MASLKTFARTHPPGKPGMPCWACSIPETDEINQGRRDGVGIMQILDWLIKEKRYPTDMATRAKLHAHFSIKRHHEAPK